MSEFNYYFILRWIIILCVLFSLWIAVPFPDFFWGYLNYVFLFLLFFFLFSFHLFTGFFVYLSVFLTPLLYIISLFTVYLMLILYNFCSHELFGTCFLQPPYVCFYINLPMHLSRKLPELLPVYHPTLFVCLFIFFCLFYHLPFS